MAKKPLSLVQVIRRVKGDYLEQARQRFLEEVEEVWKPLCLSLVFDNGNSEGCRAMNGHFLLPDNPEFAGLKLQFFRVEIVSRGESRYSFLGIWVDYLTGICRSWRLQEVVMFRFLKTFGWKYEGYSGWGEIYGKRYEAFNLIKRYGKGIVRLKVMCEIPDYSKNVGMING